MSTITIQKTASSEWTVVGMQKPYNNGLTQFQAVLQANLGTPTNGTMAYCSDCTVANPCAGGGTGALAKRLNGSWVCN